MLIKIDSYVIAKRIKKQEKYDNIFNVTDIQSTHI